jgi:hypothetical protein
MLGLPTKVVENLWKVDAMRKVKTKDGRQITVPEKGERLPGSGRVKGQPNKISMAQKLAMVWAAEHSDHSDGTLQGFYLYLANKFPQDHGRNLNRLLPLQVDARHQVVQKVIYKTSEEVLAGMAARGMSQKLIDAIMGVIVSKPPEPIDRSQPRDLVKYPLPPADDVKPGRLDGCDDGGDDNLDPQWNSAVASRRS